jgi:proteasome lid subunit RPN8/RPN11
VDALSDLTLNVATRDAVVAHLRAALPNEGCGLLLEGTAGELSFYPARNSLASPTRYSIDPEDLLGAYREERASGRRVVAAVHSHPKGPDGPSPRDRREWLTPELAMIIVSFAGDPEHWSAHYVAEGGHVVQAWPLNVPTSTDS